MDQGLDVNLDGDSRHVTEMTAAQSGRKSEEYALRSEDYIDYACLFKTALPIIDDLIGSKLLYKIDVRLGRRGNHILACRMI